MPNPNPATRALRRLAAADVRLDEATTMRLLRWAETTGDELLLATLARRADAPAAARDRYAAATSARVRAALITRPDCGAAERAALLAAENRPTVLAAVAAEPDCPPDVLETLARVRSRRVAIAVLTHPNATRAAIAAALVSLSATTGRISRGHLRVVAALVANTPEVHDTIGRGIDTVLLAHVASSPMLSADAAANVAARLVVDPSATFAAAPGPLTWKDTDSILAAARAAAELSACPAATDELLTRCADALAPLRDRLPRGRLSEFDAFYASLTRQPGTLGRRVADARRATDASQLRHLAATVSFGSDACVAAAIITNPVCTADVAAMVMTRTWWLTAETALRAHRSNPEMWAAVLRQWPDIIRGTPWAAEQLRRDHALAVAVIGALGADPSRPAAGLRAIVDTVGAQPEIVAALPCWYLSDGRAPLDPDLAAGFARLLDSRLGDNAAAWETLRGVAPSFDGAIGELLAVADLINTAGQAG